MIAECTVDNIKMLISKALRQEIIYLSINLINNELVINYNLLDEIEKEENRDKIIDNLRKNVSFSRDLIDKLSFLNKLVSNNTLPIKYELVFSCSHKEDKPKITYNAMYPSNVSIDNSKKIPINWDTVFKDRLNENIPGVFHKRSAKKYLPLSYGELVEILKKEEDKSNEA